MVKHYAKVIALLIVIVPQCLLASTGLLAPTDSPNTIADKSETDNGGKINGIAPATAVRPSAQLVSLPFHRWSSSARWLTRARYRLPQDYANPGALRCLSARAYPLSAILPAARAF